MQAFVASFLIIIGALLTGILFGEMAVLSSNLNMKSTKFQEIIDTVNTTMKNMKINEKLQLEVHEYLIFTWATLDNKDDQVEFESRISPSLKNDVQRFLMRRVIEKNVIFRRSDDKRLNDFIIQKLKNRFSMPEEELIQQGTTADRMFFLANG